MTSDNGSLWMVPISFAKSGAPTVPCHTTILRERRLTVTIDDVTPGDWVKLNPGTVGFYRTCYPASMLEQFKPAIQDKSLPPLDRLGLLDDLFALVSSIFVVPSYTHILLPFTAMRGRKKVVLVVSLLEQNKPANKQHMVVCCLFKNQF